MEQKFVLCGRVFVPFSNKDGNTYLLEVNEDYERSHLLPSDQFRTTLAAFVSWHNPIKFNQNQVGFLCSRQCEMLRICFSH